MKSFTKAAKALGDPARVKILKMLEVKPLCVCVVHLVLGLAQSTVSKHLKVLEEAGLVVWTRKGAWVHYSLAQKDGSHAGRMLALLSQCLENDPEIMSVREAVSKVSDGPFLKAVADQGPSQAACGSGEKNRW
jgi:ArsR family transcriptional regulator